MAAGHDLSPGWLVEWMQVHGIELWGAADLRDFETPADETGQGFPFSVSWAVPMPPAIMAAIQSGPTRFYADEYERVNRLINRLGQELTAQFRDRGCRAGPLAASDRTDPVNIRGDFPQKTSATRAGLGWIGRHCQLVTRRFGPWVRLGTVFTDMELPSGPPAERGFCGTCRKCVDACPAGALTGAAWRPGLPREEILDVQACDRFKKEHYFEFLAGHICGICSAVCPHGTKQLDRKKQDFR